MAIYPGMLFMTVCAVAPGVCADGYIGPCGAGITIAVGRLGIRTGHADIGAGQNTCGN